MSKHRANVDRSPTRHLKVHAGLRTFVLSLLSCCLSATAANAQNAPNAAPTGRGANVATPAGRQHGATDGISGKVLRYAEKLVAKYDADLDRRLQEPEWRRMSGTPRLADLDGDGILTVEELAQRVASYSRQRTLRLMPAREAATQPATAADAASDAEEGFSQTLEPPLGDEAGKQAGDVESSASNPQAARADRSEKRNGKKTKPFYVPPSRLPKGIANWFRERDANGDGQVSMVEYSSKWSQAEALEFARFDKNGDGIIAPEEAVVAGGKRGKNEPPPVASADAGAP